MLRDSVHARILGLSHGFIQLQLISERWIDEKLTKLNDRQPIICETQHETDKWTMDWRKADEAKWSSTDNLWNAGETDNLWKGAVTLPKILRYLSLLFVIE